jgi:hypothetical protein
MTEPDITISSHTISSTLKTFAVILLLPLIFVLGLAAFLVALGDFAWFRLQSLIYGTPKPKDVWEF